MAESDAVVGKKLVDRVGNLFKEAVEKSVTARTSKYKTSNDSLRRELAATKSKLAGVEAEFKPMSTKLSDAKKTLGEKDDRIRELKLNVELLQKELAKKTKS